MLRHLRTLAIVSCLGALAHSSLLAASGEVDVSFKDKASLISSLGSSQQNDYEADGYPVLVIVKDPITGSKGRDLEVYAKAQDGLWRRIAQVKNVSDAVKVSRVNSLIMCSTASDEKVFFWIDLRIADLARK